MKISIQAASAVILLAASAAQAQQAGAVIGWGQNHYGQCLGTDSSGAVIASATASGEQGVQLNGQLLYGVTAAVAGGGCSLALRDGSVLFWGISDVGLGAVPELARSGVSALSLASNLGVAFAVKNGGVIAWGSNQHWQCNVPSAALNNVVKVEAGSYHAFALKSDGSLVAWGRANDYGWFGAMSVPPECQIGTVDVCSTHLQNLFLKDGRVYASGSENPPVPPAGTESGVSAIARGGGYPNGMALKDGRVIVWGSNAFGQADVPPEANSGVDAIASGNGFNIALKGGRVIAWGRNDFGQGSVPPSALEDVASVAGGYGFILAVKTTASVIQGVTPISGPSSGGTRVTIRGRNFANPTTVTFGGVAATNVVVISDSIIEATTPACFPGPALVTVGQGSAQAFYYRPSCGTDANNDGVVDGNDLGILLSEWGPCE